jgi:tetratricopeptide (TPR) repeat protein
MTIFRKLTFFIALLPCSIVFADVDADVAHLQERWAEVNYQLESNLQESAFEQLIAEASAVTTEYSDSAAAWIWSGIIKSTFAGVKGGLGALSLVKDAKSDLEQAMAINPDALDGSAYTSLGTLYYSVPGWPIGFGNDEKAEELLLQALTLNPDGIDPNYFYGDYLATERRYAEARQYLMKAQQAPARPGRAVADAGRQKEINDLLLEIADK